VSSLLLRGFLLGLAVAASPGPIFFLCLRRTVVRGWLNGLFSGFGVATADGFYAAVAALVIGVILGSVSWWVVLAALAAGLRTRITPRVVRLISTISGLAIIGLGVVALVSALGM